MDSLLASYGSDEEDGDLEPGSPLPVTRVIPSVPLIDVSRRSVFGALPPPRNSTPEKSLRDTVGENSLKPLQRDSGLAGGGLQGRASLFSSLPAPRGSALDKSWRDEGDEQLRPLKGNLGSDGGEYGGAAPRASLFSSLPPPKRSLPEISPLVQPLRDNLGDGESQSASGNRDDKKLGGVLRASLPAPRFDSTALPSNFYDDSAFGSPSDTPQSELGYLKRTADKSFTEQPPPASSMFAKLPPPSTSKPEGARLQRRVVEFKPPVNLALLETTEEDDVDQSRKRMKVSENIDRAKVAKVGGLAAILPPPKNTLGAGTALGGGGGYGGRRTVMETASDYNRTSEDLNSDSVNITRKVESRILESPEGIRAAPELSVSSTGYGHEPSAGSNEGYYLPDNSSYYDGRLPNSEEQYPHDQSLGNSGYFQGNGYQNSWQYSGTGAIGDGFQPGQSQAEPPSVAISEVLRKERRKLKGELPPQMIEVKQVDLTGGAKMREDQLRTTGIAFGPTYQPVASNKDKPSKLHRRKHQIGSLYFEMKQNEMNLLDRRAKGNLTKAETQAKYGW